MSRAKEMAKFAVWVWMAGCAISERSWEGNYLDQVCAEQERCDEENGTVFAEGMCRAAGEQAASKADGACSLDKQQARSCINGEWSCSEDGMALSPEACFEVWTCEEDED